jgi:hypothetical protein
VTVSRRSPVACSDSAADKSSSRATALPDNLLGVAFRPGDRSSVRQQTEHRVADGIVDGVRRLRAARAVEVCGSAPSRREMRANRVDVKSGCAGHVASWVSLRLVARTT